MHKQYRFYSKSIQYSMLVFDRLTSVFLYAMQASGDLPLLLYCFYEFRLM